MMHSPKIVTYNLLEQSSNINAQSFPVDIYELNRNWLYMARPLVQHPYISYLKSFILPSLGLVINQFAFHSLDIPQKYTFYDYYVDVAAVLECNDTRWVGKDLYLDVLIVEGKAAHILDTDEYWQALQENLITIEEAEFALRVTHQLLNELATYDYSLETCLKSKGIDLPWRYLK